MRRLFALAVLALIGCGGSPPASAQNEASSSVAEAQIPAPALAGNLLGSPSVQPASIYLPPGYEGSARRYPVIYLLHGYGATRAVWTDRMQIQLMLDRLIRSQRMPPMIVVMPNGANALGGSFYRNSPVSGHWSDFIADDLVGYVDAHYRTLARPEARGIVGWSMGGYGAISVAMEHPGAFAAVYAISPCCLAPVEELSASNPRWPGFLMLRTREEAMAAAQQNGDLRLGLALFSAVSGDPQAPLLIRFPFAMQSGRVVEAPGAYADYAASFPLNRIASEGAGLRRLRAFGFDYGRRDHYRHIPPATDAFDAALTAAGIPHRFEAYEGDHSDHVEARLESIVLPYVAGALESGD